MGNTPELPFERSELERDSGLMWLSWVRISILPLERIAELAEDEPTRRVALVFLAARRIVNGLVEASLAEQIGKRS